MNFLAAEYFLAVARERSFTKASETLHMTQQSLSSQIASLERELGCRLFERRIPLELTYAGRTFLRYAEEIQRLHRNIRYEFSDIAQNQRGELRLGCSFVVSQQLMPRLIPAFQAVYPHISVSVSEGPSEVLRQNLSEGTLDLAITVFPHIPSDLEVQVFYQQEIVLLVSRELLQAEGLEADSIRPHIQRGDLSPLRNCPFLPVSTANDLRRVGLNLIRQSGFQPRIRSSAGNIATLLKLCAQGAGACFTPDNFAGFLLSPEELSRLELFHLPSDACYPVCFGYPKHGYPWRLVSEFIRIARQTYAGQPIP